MWNNRRLSLTAQDFFEIRIANGELHDDVLSHPDFAGSPIEFGFARFKSTVQATIESLLGVDNWTVFVNTASSSSVTAVFDEYAVAEGKVLSVPPEKGVLSNDIAHPSLAAVLVTSPRYGALALRPDGAFVYEPKPGFAGRDTFRYLVGDDTSSVLIQVVPDGCFINTRFQPKTPETLLSRLFAYVTVRHNAIAVVDQLVTLETFFATYTGRTDATGTAEIEVGPVSGQFRAHGETLGVPFSCSARFDLPLEGGIQCSLTHLFSLDTNNRSSALAAFRRFRDDFLTRTPLGRERVQQYYRFSPEVVSLIRSDFQLLAQALLLYPKFQPLISGVVAGERPSLSPEQIGELEGFLDRLQPKASPELGSAIAQLRGDLRNPRILAEFGIGNRVAAPRELLARLPLRFEANLGQSDRRFDHVVRGPGYEVALSANQVSFRAGSHPVTMRFAGANARAPASGEDRLPSATHYLLGRDPAGWLRNVPSFSKVRYSGIYPGVDLVYYGREGRLEYDFVVAPGGDPGRIALRFDGARPRVNRQGDLTLNDGQGQLILHKPVVYQQAFNTRTPVPASFLIRRDGTVGFKIASYDRRRELVIDPVLTYASYLGGLGSDMVTAISLGADGSIYLTGSTNSQNFPTVNPLQSGLTPGAGGDVFVTKLNAAGNAIVYSTYLGGADADIALGIGVDTQGSAYLTGATRSRDFPLRQPIQGAFGGAGPMWGTDAFVAKLDPSGASLVYSTYLGGSGDDGARGIAVGGDGSAIVAGVTASMNFPAALAMQASLRGGETYRSDAFVSKLNPSGTALMYSTFLGGTGDDAATALALDSSGNAYVTGLTYSRDFPAVLPLAAANSGGADVFVSKLRTDGAALLASTYLGGEGDDIAFSLALDRDNNVHIAGVTASASRFPRANAAQVNFGSPAAGGHDAFVSKINLDRSLLLYSTLLGGSGSDMGFGIALDSAGNAYVTGVTHSPDFASGDALYARSSGPSDSFIAKLDPTGSRFLFRSYLGGAEDETALAVAASAASAAYFAGSTTSVNFPVTVGAVQPIASTQANGFLARISTAATPCAYTISPTTQNLGAAAGSATFTVSTGPTCAWAAKPLQTWTTITSPATGVGPGSVTYSFAANARTTPRTGGIEVADSAAVVVTQAPLSCVFTVNPGSATIPATQSNPTFAIGTSPGCTWTATGGASWIRPTGVASGSSAGNAIFAADPNPTGSPRTAKLQIAGFEVHVSQSAANRVQVFEDVSLTHPFVDHIELLKQNNVTRGCSLTRYCPEDSTTRGQMAVFIIRVLQRGDDFPFPAVPYFQDVAPSHPFFKWIQKLRELGITQGCAATMYCPEDPVTRGQMAVFLVRAKLGVPPGFPFYHRPAPFFSDVPASHPFFPFIQKLRELGITTGCTATTYCPDAPNTRGQMAVFLIRAFFTP